MKKCLKGATKAVAETKKSGNKKEENKFINRWRFNKLKHLATTIKRLIIVFINRGKTTFL